MRPNECDDIMLTRFRLRKLTKLFRSSAFGQQGESITMEELDRIFQKNEDSDDEVYTPSEFHPIDMNCTTNSQQTVISAYTPEAISQLQPNDPEPQAPNIMFDAHTTENIEELCTPGPSMQVTNVNNRKRRATSPIAVVMGQLKREKKEKIIFGNANNFIRAERQEVSSTESISISSNFDGSTPASSAPGSENEHVRKVSFHNWARRASLPDGYDAGDPNWQYNSYLKTYEYRPGCDIYSASEELFVSLMEAAFETNESEYELSPSLHGSDGSAAQSGRWTSSEGGGGC